MYEFCVYSFQYGNVGAMAITLCQSLGQNIGMKWNNARNSAGKKKERDERKISGGCMETEHNSKRGLIAGCVGEGC